MRSGLLDQEDGTPRAPERSGTKTLMGFLWRVVLATLFALIITQLLNHAFMGERLVPQPTVEGVSQGQYLILAL